MDQLKLNKQIIIDKEFDIDIRGYNAKQVDMFLDTVYEDYAAFDMVVDNLKERLEELQKRNEELKEELEASLKNQVVSNEVVKTEQFNTIDILKRLSMLEKEVYNQKSK